MMPLAACLLAYFLGAIPFGYILVKLKTGGDVRGAGSGLGAVNLFISLSEIFRLRRFARR